jgi:SAM-dependent methyltransferase
VTDPAFKDHFSRHAELYRRHRPEWPQAMFAWLASLAPRRERAWDAGTGSGQAARALAAYFPEVLATDASAAQIAQAQPHPRVSYRVAPAERSGLEAASIDLVLAAQAFHWFDFEGFFAECRRVLRPAGIVAALTYMNPSISGPVDAVLARYIAFVFSDWPPERRFVDAGYANAPFPFPEIPLPEGLALTLDLDLEGFMGYLATWSAAQRYRERTGLDPRADFRADLAAAWGDPASALRVRWPVAGRVGRVA